VSIFHTFSPAVGERQRLNNHRGNAVRYTVDFVGTGSVVFTVLPGGSFDLIGLGGVINIYIEDIAPGGIAPV
jgi:hypothetical protein